MKLTDSECKITGARVADIRIDTKTGDPVMEAIGVYIIAVNELNGGASNQIPVSPKYQNSSKRIINCISPVLVCCYVRETQQPDRVYGERLDPTTVQGG